MNHLPCIAAVAEHLRGRQGSVGRAGARARGRALILEGALTWPMPCDILIIMQAVLITSTRASAKSSAQCLRCFLIMASSSGVTRCTRMRECKFKRRLQRRGGTQHERAWTHPCSKPSHHRMGVRS